MRLWERIRRFIVQEFVEFTYGATVRGWFSPSTNGSAPSAGLVTAANVASPLTLTAARTLTWADSGKVILLNAAGGFTVTLPTLLAGLRFRFIVKTAPTGANYIIVSASGSDVIVLSVNELETDTGDDGPYDDNADTVNFVANLAAKGDFIEMFCDGTNWYANGQTNLDGAVTSSTT